MPGDIFLGTQGWTNPHWRGSLYSPHAPAPSFLSEYSKRLRAVEIDSTFYAIPRREVVARWRESTPAEFRFTAKFPRSISHAKLLGDSHGETDRFLDAMTALEDKAGPLVLQFPFSFGPEHRDRLAAYLAGLPDRFRYAVEVRHPDWFGEPLYDMLKGLGMALVIADYGKPPTSIHVLGDWSYVRLVGNHDDFRGPGPHALLDRSRELDHWSRVIRRLGEQGIDVWAFASDVYQGKAPATILSLQERLHDEDSPGRPEE